jgi:hypothetical protein
MAGAFRRAAEAVWYTFGARQKPSGTLGRSLSVRGKRMFPVSGIGLNTFAAAKVSTALTAHRKYLLPRCCESCKKAAFYAQLC